MFISFRHVSEPVLVQNLYFTLNYLQQTTPGTRFRFQRACKSVLIKFCFRPYCVRFETKYVKDTRSRLKYASHSIKACSNWQSLQLHLGRGVIDAELKCWGRVIVLNCFYDELLLLLMRIGGLGNDPDVKRLNI